MRARPEREVGLGWNLAPVTACCEVSVGKAPSGALEIPAAVEGRYGGRKNDGTRIRKTTRYGQNIPPEKLLRSFEDDLVVG